MTSIEKYPKGRIRRRLTLSHDGRPFLERWGLCHDRFGGFYVHHIAGPDPGIDLHDHPWWFASIVLSGGYSEKEERTIAAELYPTVCTGVPRFWRRWSIHKMPLVVAHRITHVLPGTWTFVLRGPTHRVWGFYTPDGWVAHDRYDYETRRPNTVQVKR